MGVDLKKEFADKMVRPEERVDKKLENPSGQKLTNKRRRYL